jgi:Holliday junction resolvase RusA-like endonuclease
MRYLIQFRVPGEPVPQPRLTERQWRLLRIPDDRRSVRLPRAAAAYLVFREAVGLAGAAARARAGFAAPLEVEVALDVVVCWPADQPRRWDLSNVLKAVEDGLNGTVVADDRLVVRVAIGLSHSEAGEPVLPGGASVRVAITPLDPHATAGYTR